MDENKNDLLTLNDGRILVRLARHSIETFFSKKIISMPEADKFTEKQGVFVTLKELEELRGCIGFPEPVYPLKRAIIESARAAAFKDPRFLPLVESELEDVTIEVSVLTKPELLEVENSQDYLNKIVIGKHGLIIRHEYKSGLLLPQVFSEYNSTPKEALEMVCEKAGLDKEAWRDDGAEIYSFQAQVFHEEDPNGYISEKKG